MGNVSFVPCVGPYVRQLTIGNGLLQIGCWDTVAGLKVEFDDTVATVQCRDRIVVDTFDFQEPLFHCIVAVMDIEPQRVTFANRIDELREVLLTVVNYQVEVVVVMLI